MKQTAVGISSEISAARLVCAFILNYSRLFRRHAHFGFSQAQYLFFLLTVFQYKATYFVLRMYRVALRAWKTLWNPTASEECRRKKKIFALSLSPYK